jgi:hypothetical protein
MARLVVKAAEMGAQVIELNLGVNRLGRSSDNDFPIQHPTISATHCELILADGGVRVRDCASTNGTFVDGQPVKEAALSAGQILRLGDVELLVETTEVNIAIPKFDATQRGHLLTLTGKPVSCSRHQQTQATHRCTKCQEALCSACVRRVRRRGNWIVRLCPFCGGLCELLCARHYGARATHVCTSCQTVFCDACLRKLRRKGGKVLKLCPICSQECVLICPRHPQARANYRCTMCGVAFCDHCARRSRSRGAGPRRICPSCRHQCELVCSRHPEARATYQCIHCQDFLCDACVQHLRSKSGKALKFCGVCSQPCEPLEGSKPKQESLLERLQDTIQQPFARRAKTKRTS